MKKIAHLVLANGLVFKGYALAEPDQIISGELVFSTSTTGYTEVLTDPSFFGQMVVMANPEIGNYGVASDDFQSDSIKVKALIVRNLSSLASSFRAQMTLADWLMREQIPVFFGIDTRTLITSLREDGAIEGVLSTDPSCSLPDLLKKARAASPMKGKKLSDFVSVSQIEKPDFDLVDYQGKVLSSTKLFHVVVLDFGVKRSMLRYLSHFGAQLTLVPSDISVEEIWGLMPDGLFLSNGPGDPATEGVAVATVRSMLGKIPIFGVCLGHQILAQAIGLKTYKLKYGHRGSNQAVKCKDGAILTTAQNHGFAVNDSGIDDVVNISDKTNEGLSLIEQHAFSVQFHPEGSPGPQDASFYFEKFMTSMASWKKMTAQEGYVGKTVRTILERV